MSAVKVCPTCGTEYPASERFCPRDGAALRSAEPHADLVGQVVAERYHVLQKLGEGGMGQVYLAEHVRMGRRSAVKVMSPALARDADAVSRFNREAANASRITHPNVAAIYDFGETSDGLIYLAMEFVDGEPLTALIKRLGSLSIARAAAIAGQTADALTVAHDLGIVHRDLKPDNIMIGRGRDGADVVKVVDFGIAKASQNEAQKVTRTGLVVGTPEYMSPEQLAGDKLDGRSDIYALGLVTFVMLTGKLPFPSESAQEAMLMRLMEKPKTLAEMRPDVQWPPALQVVLDRVLARDATQRYAVAGDFGADLARAVRDSASTPAIGEPTTAEGAAGGGRTVAMDLSEIPPTRVAPASAVPPPSPRPALVPPARQRRTGLVIGVIAAIAVVAGGGAAVMMNRTAGTRLATQLTPPANTTLPRTDSVRRASDSTPVITAADRGSATRTPANNPRPTTPATPAGGGHPRVTLAAISNMLDSGKVSEKTAKHALTLIDELEPTLADSVPAARVEAQFNKATAYFSLGYRDAACRVLHTAQDSASGTRMERAVNSLLEQCP